MSKPVIPANDIPKDVWAAAEEALDNMLCHCRESSGSTKAFRRDSINEIAQAILAERHRHGGYQARVADAHHALFHDDPTDIAERVARYQEESNELSQAFGMSREAAHELVDYTWSRPAGDHVKEIGAALLTLASLCVVAEYDMAACGEIDLEKLQKPETIARIRAKRSTRHGRGPLPGFDQSIRSDGE